MIEEHYFKTKLTQITRPLLIKTEDVRVVLPALLSVSKLGYGFLLLVNSVSDDTYWD